MNEKVRISSRELSGKLLQPLPAESKNVIAFIQNDAAKNALILVGGLMEGMMSLSFDSKLAEALLLVDCALVQVNLSSSFYGAGIFSLDRDCQELYHVVKCLKSRHSKIVLMGNSTGCQDAIRYCKLYHENSEAMIDATILLCGVSDREALSLFPTQALEEETNEKIFTGETTHVLKTFLWNFPIRASRFRDLFHRLGDDDMFSTDLSVSEMTPLFQGVTCPILILHGEDDQYVPNKEALRKQTEVLLTILKTTSSYATIAFVPGDHSFPDEKTHPKMITEVIKFLERIL
ncbi:hypothetical protein IE077_003904 [Cardiosporidium cionae]|uniref:Uncharacterized protein n=1 Tax=Cardiosporidium cionae TaxID=476202 RepID=A0ABQ7J7B1_9APIC|nr:hypothetical protein IE077_003904 [Cardiosporidium cionae]|eukprot:KAF8819843.1 hypothetical protein IE077_003904 [Cardiosporidium cionae]